MMKCELCERNPFDTEGSALFRQNPKGEIGVWRCREHSVGPIDTVVNEIVTAIEDTK